MVLLLDLSVFLGVQWDHEALYWQHATRDKESASQSPPLSPTRSDRMDDESEVVNEASSRLQTLLSAQAEDVTRLFTSTVKGETRCLSMRRSSLM